MNHYKNVSQKFTPRLLNVLLVVFVFFTIMRGGYGTRPFMPFDIPSMVDPKLQWLASNTPFQFLHTLENENLKIETYYEEAEAERMIGFQKQFSSKEFKKKTFYLLFSKVFVLNVLVY